MVNGNEVNYSALAIEFCWLDSLTETTVEAVTLDDVFRHSLQAVDVSSPNHQSRVPENSF